MKVKFEKGSKQWELFTEYWKFVQDTYEPEDNDAYWQEVEDKSNELIKRHGSGAYIKALVLAHVDGLERRFKDKK